MLIQFFQFLKAGVPQMMFPQTYNAPSQIILVSIFLTVESVCSYFWEHAWKQTCQRHQKNIVFRSTEWYTHSLIICYPGSEFKMSPALVCTVWSPTCFNKFSLAKMDQFKATIWQVFFRRLIFSFLLGLVFIMLLINDIMLLINEINKFHCK